MPTAGAMKCEFACQVCGHHGADIGPLFEAGRGLIHIRPAMIYPACVNLSFCHASRTAVRRFPIGIHEINMMAID